MHSVYPFHRIQTRPSEIIAPLASLRKNIETVTRTIPRYLLRKSTSTHRSLSRRDSAQTLCGTLIKPRSCTTASPSCLFSRYQWPTHKIMAYDREDRPHRPVGCCDIDSIIATTFRKTLTIDHPYCNSPTAQTYPTHVRMASYLLEKQVASEQRSIRDSPGRYKL